MGFLQSQQWQFSPRESKHYALKVVLQASLNSGTGTMKPTPKKNKALLSVFGKGVWGKIKVSQKHLLGRYEINLHSHALCSLACCQTSFCHFSV